MIYGAVAHLTYNYPARAVRSSCALYPVTCREGASLYEILKAGEWSSPAFLSYLDLHELEKEAVVEAHLDESDDESDT